MPEAAEPSPQAFTGTSYMSGTCQALGTLR